MAAAALTLVFWTQYGHVRRTNFSGYDEWLYLSLAGRGTMSFPYQNRPLVLLWHLPPALLAPGSLAAYHVAHGLYLLLGGIMIFALARRLFPAAPVLAFAAGALTTVWAPMDHARLLPVTLAGYAGWTFLVLAAAFLFVEACARSSRLLLALSAAATIAAARGAEATVPLMIAGPLALVAARRPVPAALRPWVAVWAAAVLLGAALSVVPLLRGGPGVSYQSGLGLDVRPAAVAGRLARQLGFHLLPLAELPGAASAAALPTGLAFAAGVLLTARAYRGRQAALAGTDALRAGALGVALALLGYSAFTVTAALPNPVRTQFLSAGGVALALSAALCGLSARARRWSTAIVAVLGGAIAATGTARTVAMQADWDRHGRYFVQAGVLRDLVRAAPGLAPNTLVVLVDDDPAFPSTFTFHHAIALVYGRHVRGHAWGAPEFLYGCAPDASGMACAPWPVIRRDWDEEPSRHRVDEIVVVSRRAGRVEIAREWPPELGPLPAGARYDPLALVRADHVPAARGVLRDAGWDRAASPMIDAR